MISLGDFTNIYWESLKIIIKLIIHFFLGYTILDMITILGITESLYNPIGALMVSTWRMCTRPGCYPTNHSWDPSPLGCFLAVATPLAGLISLGILRAFIYIYIYICTYSDIHEYPIKHRLTFGGAAPLPKDRLEGPSMWFLPGQAGFHGTLMVELWLTIATMFIIFDNDIQTDGYKML